MPEQQYPASEAVDSTTSDELGELVETVRDEFLYERRVYDEEAINSGMCNAFAFEVYERADTPDDVVLLRGDCRRGWHMWLCLRQASGPDLHFDAERPRGVVDYTDLPFFDRMGECEVGPRVIEETHELPAAVSPR